MDSLGVNIRKGEELSDAGVSGDKLAVAAFIVSVGGESQARKIVCL